MNILECKNLTKTYGSGSNKVVALDHVNLSLVSMEPIPILGGIEQT